VIKSIDRLGRDYNEILEQWRIISKERQAAIVVIDIPLLDTREKERDLTGTFISDLVLQILSYVAQTEREMIRQRQTEGIEAAKTRGVRFGRPPKERPTLYSEVLEAWERQEISAREAGRRLNANHRTFLEWAGQ
jgi:DNA invertase Pin-like site-specific DNA recombinase